MAPFVDCHSNATLFLTISNAEEGIFRIVFNVTSIDSFIHHYVQFNFAICYLILDIRRSHLSRMNILASLGKTDYSQTIPNGILCSRHQNCTPKTIIFEMTC